MNAMHTSFFDTQLFSYGLLPVLIFLARICDVSIGTMRIIFVSKGKKYIAPLLGFFEVLIWITAVSKIMQNLDNYINYIAYAAGFATGNFVGMLIEERLAIGVQMIRIFANSGGEKLLETLHSNGFGATAVEAKGARENVLLIYTIVNRNDKQKVISLINEFNSKAFYTIEDVKDVKSGIFAQRKENAFSSFGNILTRWRSGK